MRIFEVSIENNIISELLLMILLDLESELNNLSVIKSDYNDETTENNLSV